MNKRIKKKQIKMNNKKLCKRYPFLIPRDYWTDKIPKNWDYEYTELYAFPKGWYKVFGKQMLEEIRDECIKFDYLDKLRIVQIKEKYGTLRFYVSPIPADSQIYEIIHKYEEMSAHVCEHCGRPAETDWNRSWVVTWCDKCKAEEDKRREEYYRKVRENREKKENGC